MPIATGHQDADDRAMARHRATQLSHVPIDGDQGAASTHDAMQDEPSLNVLAGRLAEIAHALRQAAANPSEVDDIESVAATMTSALGDLAVGAELAANAVIDAERLRRLSRTGVTPSPRARAVSWRLHALGSALRAARDACTAVAHADGHSRGRVGFG
jgi:hypothetical protein